MASCMQDCTIRYFHQVPALAAGLLATRGRQPRHRLRVATGGKVIFMRPCILNEGFSIQNKTRGHENDFTAHVYTEAHAIAAWTGKLPASSTPAIPEQLFVEAFLGRTLAELLQGQGSSAFLTVEPAPGSTALLAVPLNATAPVAQVS